MIFEALRKKRVVGRKIVVTLTRRVTGQSRPTGLSRWKFGKEGGLRPIHGVAPPLTILNVITNPGRQ